MVKIINNARKRAKGEKVATPVAFSEDVALLREIRDLLKDAPARGIAQQPVIPRI